MRAWWASLPREIILAAMSVRRHEPFVAVNCAAIPHELFESTLFGYEPGAFTGARTAGQDGKFQLADGGTLFLDEIGDLPLELQAKLLRAISEGRVEKVGGKARWASTCG